MERPRMTQTMAPDVRVSNSSDFDADALLGVVANHPDGRAILAGAFLEFARWFAAWAPDPRKHPPKRASAPRPGTDAWRRKHFRRPSA